MATTTVSLEEFQKDADRVDEASADGPVFLARPGRKTLVVLDIEKYRKLSGIKPTIVDLLDDPESYDIDFDSQRLGTKVYQPIELGD